jgi:hypothetical protein
VLASVLQTASFSSARLFSLFGLVQNSYLLEQLIQVQGALGAVCLVPVLHGKCEKWMGWRLGRRTSENPNPGIGRGVALQQNVRMIRITQDKLVGQMQVQMLLQCWFKAQAAAFPSVGLQKLVVTYAEPLQPAFQGFGRTKALVDAVDQQDVRPSPIMTKPKSGSVGRPPGTRAHQN